MLRCSFTRLMAIHFSLFVGALLPPQPDGSPAARRGHVLVPLTLQIKAKCFRLGSVASD